MKALYSFNPQPKFENCPQVLSDPFHNKPHPLTVKAAQLLQHDLLNNKGTYPNFFKENSGKMFGVLVCKNKLGDIGYLRAYSGMLNKRWVVDTFVPPIFSVEIMSALMSEGEAEISNLTLKIEHFKKQPERFRLLEKIKNKQLILQKNLDNQRKENQIRKRARKVLREKLKNKHSVEAEKELQFLSTQSQQDKRVLKNLKVSNKNTLDALNQKLEFLFDSELKKLTDLRKERSLALHSLVFAEYKIANGFKQLKKISTFFEGILPPGGTADCAAPKLIHFAHTHELEILGLAEFWWGASPKKEIRQHKQFYPPCRSKCHVILPYMLDGIVEVKEKKATVLLEPNVIFEDDWVVVLDKPAGLLSIPGKFEKHSVLSWLKEKYPNADGALLVHRLDQATSGILVATKTAESYKSVQKQFIQRKVKKRYVALLAGALSKYQQTIDLPLRVDLDDRPRQLVCFEYGKAAQTEVSLIDYKKGVSRVYFYPLTGRTHQLRVHAAHQLGLAMPIVGDELYGAQAERLMLHAEKIELIHPVTDKLMSFVSQVPF